MAWRPARASWVPHPPADPRVYVCRRCGITKTFNSTRPRPVLCTDCKSVLRGGGPVPKEFDDEDLDSDAPDGPGPQRSGAAGAREQLAGRGRFTAA